MGMHNDRYGKLQKYKTFVFARMFNGTKQIFLQTYACKWCGTRFCAACFRGDFNGEMKPNKESLTCKKCRQVNFFLKFKSLIFRLNIFSMLIKNV